MDSRMVQWTSSAIETIHISPHLTSSASVCWCSRFRKYFSFSPLLIIAISLSYRFLITKTHLGTQFGGVRSTSQAAKYLVGVGFELLPIRSNFEDIFVFFLSFNRALIEISPKILLRNHLTCLVTISRAFFSGTSWSLQFFALNYFCFLSWAWLFWGNSNLIHSFTCFSLNLNGNLSRTNSGFTCHMFYSDILRMATSTAC